MNEEALAWKSDLIITKSVSSFARNTADSLTTFRLLKELGMEVYFEYQNVYTLYSRGACLSRNTFGVGDYLRPYLTFKTAVKRLLT